MRTCNKDLPIGSAADTSRSYDPYALLPKRMSKLTPLSSVSVDLVHRQWKIKCVAEVGTSESRVEASSSQPLMAAL